MAIWFTKHAENKFAVLERHKFSVSREQVLEVVRDPDLVDESRLPLLIAQKAIDQDHVLRVVYKVERGNTIIITFYPGQARQYGKGE